MTISKQKKAPKFAFKRRQTITTAKKIVALETRFNKELSAVTLPCGEKINLASSISRYEKVRLMKETKGYSEYIPHTNCEYIARMINAYHLKSNRGIHPAR
jgi:predicted secreted protein